MPALRIEGYVIVSADGMLADARNIMPDELKFEGDKAFFTAALDRADLILHGRNSYEDQPNSPRRKRVILTRKVDAIAPDPANPKATLWNPAGASFEAAPEEMLITTLPADRCGRAARITCRVPTAPDRQPLSSWSRSKSAIWPNAYSWAAFTTMSRRPRRSTIVNFQGELFESRVES